jgi:hypothetical protein
MHVRTKDKTKTRHGGGMLRRSRRAQRVEADPAPAPADVPAPAEDDLADERRLRESGGPNDRATYTCTCGYVFEAAVSTSVACPHCGTGQAW